jgi:hypothetical protein
MKRIILAALALVVSTSAFAQVKVRGYTRSDGTYVAPHYRSSPNSTRLDNYSTRGNVNPYTGQVGNRNPYGSNSFGYGTNTRSTGSVFGSTSNGSLYDDDEPNQ